MVPDGDVVLDVELHPAIGVDDRAVLHVDAAADADGGDIAANGDMVHDRALVAERDIPADIGRRRNINLFTENDAVGKVGEVKHGWDCTARARG